MSHYEKTERLAAVVFRHLPRTTSRQAQDAHKLAKAIALDVVEDLARIWRKESNQ